MIKLPKMRSVSRSFRWCKCALSELIRYVFVDVLRIEVIWAQISEKASSFSPWVFLIKFCSHLHHHHGKWFCVEGVEIMVSSTILNLWFKEWTEAYSRIQNIELAPCNYQLTTLRRYIKLISSEVDNTSLYGWNTCWVLTQGYCIKAKALNDLKLSFCQNLYDFQNLRSFSNYYTKF